jgi:hypothetical protein
VAVVIEFGRTQLKHEWQGTMLDAAHRRTARRNINVRPAVHATTTSPTREDGWNLSKPLHTSAYTDRDRHYAATLHHLQRQGPSFPASTGTISPYGPIRSRSRSQPADLKSFVLEFPRYSTYAILHAAIWASVMTIRRQLAASTLDRPEKYISVSFDYQEHLSFGGSFEPAFLLAIVRARAVFVLRI